MQGILAAVTSRTKDDLLKKLVRKRGLEPLSLLGASS